MQALCWGSVLMLRKSQDFRWSFWQKKIVWWSYALRRSLGHIISASVWSPNKRHTISLLNLWRLHDNRTNITQFPYLRTALPGLWLSVHTRNHTIPVHNMNTYTIACSHLRHLKNRMEHCKSIYSGHTNRKLGIRRLKKSKNENTCIWNCKQHRYRWGCSKWPASSGFPLFAL